MSRWKGVAFRATTYDVPLWVRPNRRDGRWNIGGQDCTQYFSLDPEAPFAEMLRHLGLRTEEEAAMLRINLWQVKVEEGAIADYGSFELAEKADFPPEAVIDDDHERCQREAQWLKSHGARGILSPSAALPGSTNLTLFGPRVEVSWGAQPSLASEVPARRVGGRMSPPIGLPDRVRFFGEPHSGFVAYSAARVRARRRQRPS